MAKIKAYVVVAFMLVCCLFTFALWEIQDGYEKEKRGLEKELQEKQELIESQVRMLIKLRDNCTCEWLYDFYLEHAEEVGAYE